jgi:hypothetical protein
LAQAILTLAILAQAIVTLAILAQKNVRIGYPNKFEKVPSAILNPANSCSLGMLSFLRNLHMREKIKDGFESRNSWFRKFIEKLVG